MNGENNSAAEFNYAIPMLKKGFDMLEIMTHYPEGITMLEITQAMGLSKTTVYRLLGSLRKHSNKCTFYTLRFGCSFAVANTIKPQLL